MIIKSIGMAVMLGLCASVPAVASTSEMLKKETRGVASEVDALTVQGRVVAVDATTQTMLVMGPQGNAVRVPLIRFANGNTVSQGEAVALSDPQ